MTSIMKNVFLISVLLHVNLQMTACAPLNDEENGSSTIRSIEVNTLVPPTKSLCDLSEDTVACSLYNFLRSIFKVGRSAGTLVTVAEKVFGFEGNETDYLVGDGIQDEVNSFEKTVVNVLLLSHVKNLKACKTGWTFFSRTGMCYKYITEKKTPVDALNHCKQLANKGSLVSIHNEETISFILSITNQQNTLIGAYRVVDGQNKWAWYDGTPWDYTSWNSGEPNDFGSKGDFVEMYAHAEYSGKWNDDAGINQYAFVCQAPRTLASRTAETAPATFATSYSIGVHKEEMLMMPTVTCTSKTITDSHLTNPEFIFNVNDVDLKLVV